MNQDYDSVIVNLLKYEKIVQAGYHQQAQPILDDMLKNEQLTDVMSSNQILKQFKEAKIKFRPTYKLEEHQNSYKQKKSRIPSWTDRIIYSVPEDGSLTVLRYGSYDTFGSDHR